MRLTAKKERQIGVVLQKKQAAYDKFYAEYKDKTLEELQKIYQEIKPGGVRKAAMLDIVNGKMELAQAELVQAVAHDSVRENIESLPQESGIEDAQIIEEKPNEDTV